MKCLWSCHPTPEAFAITLQSSAFFFPSTHGREWYKHDSVFTGSKRLSKNPSSKLVIFNQGEAILLPPKGISLLSLKKEKGMAGNTTTRPNLRRKMKWSTVSICNLETEGESWSPWHAPHSLLEETIKVIYENCPLLLQWDDCFGPSKTFCNVIFY